MCVPMLAILIEKETARVLKQDCQMLQSPRGNDII